MANTPLPQKTKTIQQGQKIFTNEQKNTRYVRQDGYAPRRVRVASRQAVRISNTARTRDMDTNSHRTKKRSTNRQTIHVAVWAPRPISLQIDRVAADMGITRSKAGLFLIEQGLAHNVFGDHLKVIIAAIAAASAKEARQNHKPYRDNSYRSAFYSAQNRTLLTNFLHLFVKLLEEPPDTTRKIIRKSEEEAREALTILTPQLADLIRKTEHDERQEEEREE
jgi:hypothetical protein